MSYADCRALQKQELIDHSDLIFEGKPISVQRHWINTFTFGKTNYYTSFEVLNVIKGKNKDVKNVDIHYRFSPNSRVSPAIKRHPYTIGDYYLVFTDYEAGKYVYTISCYTPAFSYDSAYVRGASPQYLGAIKLLYEQMKYPNKEELFVRLKLREE